MARKNSKKKTRRRRKTGISVVNLAETYMLANVATQTFFKTNPFTFVTGNISGMRASGVQQLSLAELFQPKQGPIATTAVIRKNLNEGWMRGVAGMILIPIGFRVGKQLAAPAIRKTNALLDKVGLKKTVKV